MKNYLITQNIIALITVLFLFSCKKENENRSNTDLLTSKAWVIQKNEAQQKPGDPWIDYWPFEPDCERDNKWLFKTDLSLELNESLLPCNGN